MNNKTIHEKWAIDVAAYDSQKTIKTATPQCEKCVSYIKGDALHCRAFFEERKPLDVMFAHKACARFESDSPISLRADNDFQDRMMGGIWGFCIGDMVGVPVEFSSREERDADPVNELRAYGTYHQPFGTWSDDSSLMFCLIDAICSGDVMEQLRNNMIAYYNEGRFTPNDYMFDIGNSTRAAIIRMIDGLPLDKCGGTDESDNGNGSLMRILPLAFICGDKTERDIVNYVTEITSITHGHARAVLACIFYTVFAYRLYLGERKAEAYEFTIGFVQAWCGEVLKNEKKEFSRIISKEIITLDRKQIRSTGYVVDTLEAVIWVLFNSKSYREAVLKAVNLGGDTDTIAALVGGLAGAEYGIDALPQEWLQCVSKKASICELVYRFAEYLNNTGG